MRQILHLVAMAALTVVTAQGQYITSTGITGFWDYQTSYRTPQYVRICPASSTIHATMMVSDDSLATSTSRRTAYAYSTDAGNTWTTFGQIRVPNRRSGYPSLDIGQGPYSCAPIIANHSTIGTTPQSSIHVDYPAGGGSFTEIVPPPAFGGADEPVFAEIAGGTDGSAVLVASRMVAGTAHFTRTADFVSWQPWSVLTLDLVGDDYVAEGNSSSRVGIVVTRPGDALKWLESTDNGATWPASPSVLLPAEIPLGSDTFAVIQGLDLAYPAGDTLIAFGTTKLIDGNLTARHSGIGFYSEYTGFVLAVPHASIPGVVDTLRKRQANQNPVGYPAIGVSGSLIMIAFQAFRPETSQAGFNYSDIFLTYSGNGGRNWLPPRNLTNTPNLDERYPSISKWNPAGQANIVYQEDPQPGSAVFGGDNSPLARVRQKFCRVPVGTPNVGEGGKELAGEFALHRNYPNPFNPATHLGFWIGEFGRVSLRVYDVLGREVTTLLNEVRQPGTYTVEWNGRSGDGTPAPSGIYIYRLTVGRRTASGKMVLLR